VGKLTELLRRLFDSTREEGIAQKGASPARWHHYFFAHSVLPGVFFGDPENFLYVLRRDGDDALLASWERVGRGLEKADLVSPAGLTHEMRKLEQDTTVALITLPRPRVSPEAFCVAAVYRPATQTDATATTRFFTMESRQLGDGDEPIIGEWTPSGNHQIRGAVSGNDTEQLLLYVCHLLNLQKEAHD